MAVEKKNSYIANFNCTFGKHHEPMLNYFKEVIYPAFTMRRENHEKQYLIFDNVKILLIDGVYMLTGLIIKRTELEVMSRYVDGELQKTNIVLPSDPFSFFVINLKNHRLVLTKNQKGSPTLSNFNKLADSNIKKVISDNNKYNDKKLPKHQLKVVAIPFRDTIKQELERVKKINNVTLRFYPLNGDILDNEIAEHLHKSLDKLGSNTGNIKYNTPTNKNNVAKVIDDTKGLMEPTIKVEYKDGSTRTLKDGSFTQVVKIPINDDSSIEKNIENISDKVMERKEFYETSQENKSIYSKFLSKIEDIYRSIL